jgi:hypothetical protein
MNQRGRDVGGPAPVYETPVDAIDGRLSTSCVEAERVSRLFLLDDNDVRSMAHDRYVELARGETAVAEFVGRRFILVDLYLRMARGQVQAIVNQTCSWLVFDVRGLPDLQAAQAIDAEAAPSEQQWAQVRTLAFSDACVALAR